MHPLRDYRTTTETAAYLRVLADQVEKVNGMQVHLSISLDYVSDAEHADRKLREQKRGCRRGKSKP